MNQREKLLSAAVAALVVLMVGYHYYGNYTKALHARLADLETARGQLDDANHKLRLGHKALEQMEAWQQRALPANYEKSLSLYKAWLLGKAKDAGLAVSDITFVPSSSGSTAYKAIAYHMEATGSLSSVVSLLYEFYRSPQLHQINRLNLSRAPGATQLIVRLDVEALSMKGAVATDKLPEGDPNRLKLASADEYKKSLGERDLSIAYSPPRPPTPPRVERHDAPPAPPKFDDSEYAMFTGTVGSDKELQAWISVWTTGEAFHVVSGDKVKVGALEGEIVSVEPLSLVYKSGDKKFRVALGQSLRKGKEIGSSDATKEKPASPPKS